MKYPIELRSDTVTHPTSAMRKIISKAPARDIVHGMKPAANTLERRASELLNTEAIAFVPDGIMGNPAKLRLHSRYLSAIVENTHIVIPGACPHLAGRPTIGDQTRRILGFTNRLS